MAVVWKSTTRRVGLTILFLLSAASCAVLSSAKTLEEVKARLDCVEVSDEVKWEEVQKLFGRPDETPTPPPGSLFRNIRVYKDKAVLFYVDTKETVQAGRSTFIEVVKKVEVCKEK
jgi:hypothetical protein